MTLEQYKAKAYDILVEIERLQMMLRQVNQAIATEAKKKPDEDTNKMPEVR